MLKEKHMLTPAQYNAAPLKLRAGEIIVGKKASKAAQVTTKDGKQITLCFGTSAEPVETPFGLSVWGDAPADRVSLDSRATPEMEQCVQKLDQQILVYVGANVKNTSAVTVARTRCASTSDRH